MVVDEDGFQVEGGRREGGRRGRRAVLAGRAEALRTREAELRQKAQGSDDVRVQLARKKMGETELQLKAAGGKTQSKLVFTVMDARRDVGEAEKALCAAKEALAEASKQAAERLQAEGRAEARVRAREGELANCKSRVAHLGFQFAAEAGSEVQGFEELSTAMQEVWASVEEAGMQETLRKLQRVAAFIQKLWPVDYAASADSELRELASGDTDSVATRVVGDEAGTGEAAMEVQQQVAAVGNEIVPVQTLPPAAFRSAEQARTAAQLAASVGHLPIPAAWREGRGSRAAGRGEREQSRKRSRPQRGRSASRSRGREKGEAGSVEGAGEKSGPPYIDIFMGTAELGEGALLENCLACNAIVRAQELCAQCECGGPVCKERSGANHCMRCQWK